MISFSNSLPSPPRPRPASSPSRRIRPRDPRRLVPLDQEGGDRAQALGAQPQGQGLQVPSHPDREQDPPLVALLQGQRSAGTQLEVRKLHRFHLGCLRGVRVDVCVVIVVLPAKPKPKPKPVQEMLIVVKEE